MIQGLIFLALPLLFTAVFFFDIFPEMTVICWGIFGIVALFYFVTGYGLYKGKDWARLIAIVFAIIGLINIPIGTVISIIILIYLFKDEVKAYFE